MGTVLLTRSNNLLLRSQENRPYDIRLWLTRVFDP